MKTLEVARSSVYEYEIPDAMNDFLIYYGLRDRYIAALQKTPHFVCVKGFSSKPIDSWFNYPISWYNSNEGREFWILVSDYWHLYCKEHNLI